ncbi:hypothetical protein [Actinophytocola glycyrrhizae]|uniref:Mce-associated membrane protein n=1 Tax=Actinophytocola glycyrrhizae TaxID=2044873 RepID=A0ABV9S2V9_9PSEU
MTDPQQSDAEPTASPRRRRRPPAWLVGAGAALAVIVAMVLLRDGGDGDAAVPRDLSTPKGAAEAFAMAAAAGDVDGVFAAACLGDDGCAAEHGGDVTAQQITAAKKVITDNVREIGGRLRHAQFTTARDGAQPGTQEVDYRLPGASPGERNYLIFVQYRDRWLYIASGGTTAPATASAPAT